MVDQKEIATRGNESTVPQAPGAAAQIRPHIKVLLSTKQEDGSSEPWSETFRGPTH